MGDAKKRSGSPRRGWALLALLTVALACLIAAINHGPLKSVVAHQLEGLARQAAGLGWLAGWMHTQTPTGSPVPAADDDHLGVCQLKGTVDSECCNCTYEAVDALNHRTLHPLLTQLVKTAYFRYFKVNIYCDCPLWPDDAMCALEACAVCECQEGEVPAAWLAQERGSSCTAGQGAASSSSSSGPHQGRDAAAPAEGAAAGGQAQQAAGDGGNAAAAAGSCIQCSVELEEGRVDTTVDPSIKGKLLSTKGWRGINNPWMAEPGEANGGADESYQYINLVVNPERYTGYKGEHAWRIWQAIYSQSCFHDMEGCTEKRVFYRLVSGIHASISAHIAANFLLDEEQGTWGHSLGEFERRFGSPDVRYRVENMYFAYLFLLRAVMKAGPLLAAADYSTGLADEDAIAANLMRQVASSSALQAACAMPFDEGRLWKGEQGPQLMELLQTSFQNITSIMDCVGCEKCKLWGKLQMLGIATALKILFHDADCMRSGSAGAQRLSDLVLERNEVIALVNTLERLSQSLEYYRTMAAALQAQQGVKPSVQAGEPVS